MFESLVELLHDAGVLYSCHVFPGDADAEKTANVSRRLIFAHLEQLAVTEIIAQDLTWPTFIAGTECQDCNKRQNFVESKMLEIMRLSGKLERPRLLQFLKEFWHLEGRTSASWIAVARSWAQEDKPILIM